MDVERIGRYLHDLKANSWDVFNLAVIGANGQVIASTDPVPARTERLAALLFDLLPKAVTVSTLTARGEAEIVYLKYDSGYLCGVPIIPLYFHVLELKAEVKLAEPTPASPHLALPYLREMLDERISRYLHEIKAASPDVFNLAVIARTHVFASTDPYLARTERLATLLSELMFNAITVSSLTQRGRVDTICLNFENAYLVLEGIGRWYSNYYTYVMEMNPAVKPDQPTPASPHLALAALRVSFVEKLDWC